MTRAQAMIRDRAGTVHRVECLHRHSHSPVAPAVECSVWEVKTGTETAFDVQILLAAEARRKWGHSNPGLPFCPGGQLAEPHGNRRFTGAIGVVEAVLHVTDLDRDCRILVDPEGGISLAEGAGSSALRDQDGGPLRIELEAPPGTRPI